ncbi:MAG: hypothetical protein ABIQ93_03385 [Saprospiraceae bacterium]
MVGFVTNNPPNVFPAAIDSNSPSKQRSYVGTNGTSFVLLDTVPSLAGNLYIRATVELAPSR